MAFVSKADSRFMRIIGWLLKPINKDFMTHFWTTIGDTIYVPTSVDMRRPNWQNAHKEVIEHEMVHVRQFEDLGLPLMAFLYLMFPIPVFFCWGRWALERDAYLVQIRAVSLPDERARAIEWVVNTLWSNYGWCWPRSWMQKWFEENA